MSKLQEVLNGLKPAHRSRLTIRHVVALYNLSQQVGVQSVTLRKSIRIDLTADPEALLECVEMGLALRERKFVTVSLPMQDALPEWLEWQVFPEPAPSAP